MKKPIDIVDGCAFTITTHYWNKVYVKNVGKGGSHYPATSVMEIYETEADKYRQER